MQAGPDPRLDELGERLRERVERAHRRPAGIHEGAGDLEGPPAGSSPKNIRSTATCAASRQLWPEIHSGYGAVMSAVQVGVGLRRGVAVLHRSWDRVPRPPEVEVVLVVPAVDRRVRAAQVLQREEPRAVGGVETGPCDELPGDFVPARKPASLKTTSSDRSGPGQSSRSTTASVRLTRILDTGWSELPQRRDAEASALQRRSRRPSLSGRGKGRALLLPHRASLRLWTQLLKRYFIKHANVRNAIKLAPIAIQAHTDMTSPSPPVSLLDDPTDTSFPVCSTVFRYLRVRLHQALGIRRAFCQDAAPMVRRPLDEATRQPKNWGLLLMVAICAEFWIVVTTTVAQKV